MYLVGADHPNKARARRLLERFIDAHEKLVTSAEVFQEILHRFSAIRRRDAIEPAWRVLEELTDEVFAIDFETVNTARALLRDVDALSARDALHAATMARAGVDRILSFDRGFDLLPDLRPIR